MSLTNHKNGSVTLSDARHLVCLEAAFELEALAFALPGLVPAVNNSNLAHYAVRGFSGRLLQLAEALMGGLSDTVMETKELERRVHLTSFESLGD
jgi:hypothetical protein